MAIHKTPKSPGRIIAELILLGKALPEADEIARGINEVRENRVIPQGNESLAEHEFSISSSGERKKTASFILWLSGMIRGKTASDDDIRDKLATTLCEWSGFFHDADSMAPFYAREWFRFSVRHGMKELNDIWAKNHFGHVGGEKTEIVAFDKAAIDDWGKDFFTPERLRMWIGYGWNPNDAEKNDISWGIADGRLDTSIADIVSKADMFDSGELPPAPQLVDEEEDEEADDTAEDSPVAGAKTANHGVWSEVGTFLTIAIDRKMTIPGSHPSDIRIQKVSIDGHTVDLTEDTNSKICIQGVSKNKQPFEIEKNWVKKILSNWKSNFLKINSRSFAPKSSLAELLNRLSGGEGYSPNTSREKTDLVIIGIDGQGKEVKYSTSIKSFGGGDPSLFNAAAGAAIEYSVLSPKVLDDNTLNGWVDEYKKSKKDKQEGNLKTSTPRPLDKLADEGTSIQFVRFIGKDFEDALRSIDKDLPMIVSTVIACSYRFHGCESKNIKDIIEHMSCNPELLPLSVQKSKDPQKRLKDLVGKWLLAASVELTSTGRSKTSGAPNAFAFTSSDENGKLKVDIYPFDHFDVSTILLPTAKIGTPSRSKFISKETPHPDFPDTFPYKDEEHVRVRLNHQIRLNELVHKPVKSSFRR